MVELASWLSDEVRSALVRAGGNRQRRENMSIAFHQILSIFQEHSIHGGALRQQLIFRDKKVIDILADSGPNALGNPYRYQHPDRPSIGGDCV